MGMKFEGKVTVSFDALITKLSSPEMQRGAAIGLNEHIREQEKRAANFIAGYTNQPQGLVKGATSSVKATPGAVMSAKVVVKYPRISAGENTHRSWTRGSAGAVHGDWRGRVSPGSFTIAKWDGAIFKRTTSKRYPLKKIWGPILASELTQEDRPNIGKMRVFMDQDALACILKHVGRAIG